MNNVSLRIGIVALLLLSPSITYASTFCAHITGIQDALLANVHAVLKTNTKTNCTQIKKPLTQSQVLQSVRASLQPFGFFHPHITYQIQHERDKTIWYFHIQAGAPILVHHIQITALGDGRNNPKIVNYINHFPLETGDIFNTQIYEKGKDRLYLRAKNQGFIKAYIESKAVINPARNQADINVQLITGARYYFGALSITNDIYSRCFMQRIVCFNKNEPFSSKKLLTLQSDMEKSYYFKRVTITPDLDNINGYNEIPITLDYTVPRAYNYSLGVGYGTLTGARISAAANFRRLNREGHHIDIDLVASSVLTRLNAFYYIPGRNPLNDEWLIGTRASIFSPKHNRSKSITLLGGYSNIEGKIKFNMNANLLLDLYNVQDKPFTKSHAFYPNMKISYLNADNITNPNSAFHVSLNLQGASDRAFSTTSFFQSQLKVKYIGSPVTFGKFVLRGDAGYTTVSRLNYFPLSLRYFAGGINSIRGFADSSIGPGKYLYVGSGEYQQKVTENLSAAIFYDLGTATNHIGSPVNRGAGVGLIYSTMVGPIKLYAAKAISKSRRPNSIEFSAGPEFS